MRQAYVLQLTGTDLWFRTFICGRKKIFQEVFMTQENDGMAKGLIMGFIAGSIVGAAIALLYAPKSGREFRSDLKEKAGDLMDDAQEYMDRAKSKAVEIVNEGKKRANTLVDDARKKADSILTDADRVINSARSKTEGSKNA
jgi:gas vesicle protein